VRVSETSKRDKQATVRGLKTSALKALDVQSAFACSRVCPQLATRPPQGVAHSSSPLRATVEVTVDGSEGELLVSCKLRKVKHT